MTHYDARYISLSGSLRGVEKNQVQPQSVKRITYSYWEVDALAEDIVNVRSSRGVASVNPGLQAIWEDEKNRRRAQERTSQITPQTSMSRPETVPTANELMHKQRLAQKLQNVVLEVMREHFGTNWSNYLGNYFNLQTCYTSKVAEIRAHRVSLRFISGRRSS